MTPVATEIDCWYGVPTRRIVEYLTGTHRRWLEQELPWIEAVWFFDINMKNIEGLYSLRRLQHFGVHPKRPPIDFARFPELRKAIVEPKPRDSGLGSLMQLQSLHV